MSVTWAYGVVTTTSRLETLLPRTLRSLASAGFDEPRLFVDGSTGSLPEDLDFLFHATHRCPRVRTFGNWILALMELYIRQPAQKRYALFQDDLVTYKNLREYLERCPWPNGASYGGITRPKGYWNLYTFPENYTWYERKDGWYYSNQCGRGAVALIFSREQVQQILSSNAVVSWIASPHNSWRRVDGVVLEALHPHGHKEMVHHPSLVQHTGLQSSMECQLTHPLAENFFGEDFDALEILKEGAKV